MRCFRGVCWSSRDGSVDGRLSDHRGASDRRIPSGSRPSAQLGVRDLARRRSWNLVTQAAWSRKRRTKSPAGPSLLPFEADLLLNGAFGEGLGLQAVVGDARSAFDRQAEGSLVEASL